MAPGHSGCLHMAVAFGLQSALSMLHLRELGSKTKWSSGPFLTEKLVGTAYLVFVLFCRNSDMLHRSLH